MSGSAISACTADVHKTCGTWMKPKTLLEKVLVCTPESRGRVCIVPDLL